MENSTATKPATGLQKINKYLTDLNTQNYLEEVLGEKKSSFITNCISLVSNNVNLQNCSPSSIMYAAIKATSLELPLDNNLGFAYVLPYKNNVKNIYEAQFQLGYKGFIQLALRSGQFKLINVTNVKAGEISEVNRLTGETAFNWNPDPQRELLNDVGFIAFFRLHNGFEKSYYMSVEELKTHAKKYSRNYDKNHSNWIKMFEAMATKTVLKLLLSKYAPLSVQMKEAIVLDQAVITETGVEYIDSTTIEILPEETSETEETKRILKFIEGANSLPQLNKVVKTLDPDLKIKFESQIENRENEILTTTK